MLSCERWSVPVAVMRVFAALECRLCVGLFLLKNRPIGGALLDFWLKILDDKKIFKKSGANLLFEFFVLSG